MKSTKLLLLVALLMLCGFSASAQTIYSAKLGDYGLTKVSEVTQFFTGKARLWKNKGVQVYSPKTGRRYRKTTWRMRHLPKNALVKINSSLVNTTSLKLNTPQSITSICAKVSAWKCEDRLIAFNAASTKTQEISTITVPGFFPAIPNPPAPPQPPPPQPKQSTSSQSFNLLLAASIGIILLAVIISLFLMYGNPPPPTNPNPLPRRGQVYYRTVITSFQKGGVWIRDIFSQKNAQPPSPHAVPTTAPPSAPPSILGLNSTVPIPETQQEKRARVRKIVPYSQMTPKEQKLQQLLTALENDHISPDVQSDRWPIVEVRVPKGASDKTYQVLVENQSALFEGNRIDVETVKDTSNNKMLQLFTVRFRDP